MNPQTFKPVKWLWTNMWYRNKNDLQKKPLSGSILVFSLNFQLKNDRIDLIIYHSKPITNEN